jgi:hypothetical protein
VLGLGLILEEVVDLDGGAGAAQADGVFAVAGVRGVAGDVAAAWFQVFDVAGFAIVLVDEVFDVEVDGFVDYGGFLAGGGRATAAALLFGRVDPAATVFHLQLIYIIQSPS